MLQNYDIDIQDFLKLTNSGLKVADFVQVKAAIVRRYKAAYGQDIDVSPASADGVFINDLSLIVNNILQTINTIYSNLDVNYATGAYLDMLCRLSNISRKQPTNSTATVTVKNIGISPIVLPVRMEFFDISGVQWTATNNSEITLTTSQEYDLQVVCDEPGEVTAPAGSIISAVDGSLTIEVTQSKDAIEGDLLETDSELRARRAQSTGSDGTTVLEGLVGALLDSALIQDCKVFNNSTSENSQPTADGTVLTPHSVYVVLRKKQNVEISDQTIGSLIYEKLTPGINTNSYSGSPNSGVNKSYEYIPEIVGTYISVFSQTVSWKECKSISPQFEVTIQPLPYFGADLSQYSSSEREPDDDTFRRIGRALMNYMNSLRIGQVPTDLDVQLQTVYADPQFRNNPTFTFIDSSQMGNIANPDTYFFYDKVTVAKNESNNQCTLFFSKRED